MKKRILDIIYKAIEDLKSESNVDICIEKSLETKLIGADGNLDSLSLVSLLIIIEQKLEDEFDKTITIADERAMSQKNSPFKSVKSLSDYIYKLTKDEKNEQ